MEPPIMKDGQDNSATVATEWKLLDPFGGVVAIEQTAIKALARINGYKPTVETLLAYEEQGWRIVPTPPNEDELVKALEAIANCDARSVGKADMCAHERYGYEHCENCLSDYALEALANYRARKGEQG
jgi:hypothetical protein